MNTLLKPGSRFPDLKLPDHTGIVRELSELSELADGDPIVVTLFRGWWCPKEQAFFHNLVALQDEMEVAYSRMVSVSIDTLAAFRVGLGARWTFLSDAGRRYLEQLGLRETTDTVYRPYVPTVFVLAPDLTIHAANNGYWFWGRPTNEELRRDLRVATR